MKLLFLGAGSAFTVGENNFHSNMLLLADNDKKLLIDCGSDARHSLAEAGYKHKDITDIYISHLHADHAGGLEWIGFSSYFDPTCQKPNLHISDPLITPLWDNVLSGGMSSLQGMQAKLNTFFNVHPIKKPGLLKWNHIEFQLVQTVHVMSGFLISPSYGLLFKVDNKTVFITTDTQFSPYQIMDFYDFADIIFHDCETAAHPSRVHAHYNELKTLSDKIKNKMWLYHYNIGEKPDPTKDGFRGFVKKMQLFDFTDEKTLF